jgi:REP element-mobilizing transposase RayT
VQLPLTLAMARIARFVVPGLPHHVTQRGNQRERVFFGDDDYVLYRDLLADQCRITVTPNYGDTLLNPLFM